MGKDLYQNYIEAIYKTLENLGVDKTNTSNNIIYHYTSIKRAAEILSGSKLRFGDPADFNDPFDMKTDLIRYDTEKELMRDFYLSFRPNLTDKALDFYTNSEYFSKVYQELGKKEIEEQKKKVGVACFSKTNRSILMWSHYGNNHKGVCIGFDYSNWLNLLIADVAYKKEKISANYFKTDIIPFIHLAYIKSIEWGYEKEVRALCLDVSEYCDEKRLMPFDKSRVKEIYFGVSTSSIDKQFIRSILIESGYDNVFIKELDFHPTEYGFKE